MISRRTAAAAAQRHRITFASTLHATAYAAIAIAAFGAADAHAQFNSTPVTTATVGEQYTYAVDASGSNSGPGRIEITAPNGLPDWLALIDTGNGGGNGNGNGNGTATLTGVPTQAGVFTVLLRAESPSCQFIVFFCPTQQFSITASAPQTPDQPPTVVPPGIANQTAAVGTPFSVDVAPAFTDPDADPLTFSAVGLPASLTLTGSTIAGTALAAEALAPYTVTVTANDGRGGTVATSFTLTVTPDQLPTVVPPGIPDQLAQVNQPLSLDVAPFFVDGDGDPLTFAVAGLPPGFNLLGTVISGTPNRAAGTQPPSTVVVTANDGRGGQASDNFLLTIVPLGSADVSIAEFTATPAPAVRNAPITWNLRLANAGPSQSSALTVNLEFAGTPVAFAANACTLTVAADRQRLACSVAAIASGASQTLTLTATASQPGDVYVTATVATNGSLPEDPVAGNNTAAASTSVADTIVTGAAQTIALGAAAIAGAKLNSDAFTDLAVGYASADPAALLLNIENPTTLDAALRDPRDARRGLTSVPLSFGAAAAATDVALADLDGDGDLDVIVAHGPGAATAAFANGGTGAVTPFATFGPAARDDRALATADVDGDGKIDVVVASADGTRVFFNRGGGTFDAGVVVSNRAGAIDVLLVDVAGSALPDIVIAYEGGPVLLQRNDAGTFAAATTVDAGPAVAVASGDFNRDGRADLVLARSVPASSGVPSNPVYLNNGAGAFVAVAGIGAAPSVDVVAGDVDGDGNADVIALNANGAHRVFAGDGSGGFRPQSRLMIATGARRGVLAAIGRRGSPDLVTAGGDAVHVFLNDGRGNFGLGDTTRPVIVLQGAADVSFEIGGAYADAGATASDDADGALTPTVVNPVNAAVIGAYTVTYNAVDSAGNAAVPVLRAVHVNAGGTTNGGGGGAVGIPALLLLLAALTARRYAPVPTRRKT